MAGHVTFLAAAAVTHTVANPGPTEFPATGATLNRRSFADLTGQTRARLYLGNSTVGANTCEEYVEYTTDLTGASGWTALGTYDDVLDGASGPLVNASAQNYRGPWVTIAPGARQLVALRVMGRFGDGAAHNVVALRMEHHGDPVYAGQSVAGGPNDGDVGCFGGSQFAGGGTFGEGAGEFGVLPAPLVAVPPGCTLVRDGVVLTQHDDHDHGVEAGILAELADNGKTANLVCRYLDATVADYWTDTGLAILAADAVTAGRTLKKFYYIGGGGDGQSNSTVGLYDFALLRLRNKLVELFGPDIVFVVMPQASSDLVEHPKIVEARVIVKRRIGEPWGGRQIWVDNAPVTALLQADNRHPTSAGHVVQGRVMTAPLIAAGLFS